MASFSLLSISPNIPNFLVPPNFPCNIPNFLCFQDILRGVYDPTQRDPGQRGVQIFGGGHGEQLRGELQEPGVPHQQLAANVFQPGSIVADVLFGSKKNKISEKTFLSPGSEAPPRSLLQPEHKSPRVEPPFHQEPLPDGRPRPKQA